MPLRRLSLIGGAAALLPRRALVRADSRSIDHPGTLMAQHHVPAASVALIRNGAIAERMAIGADPQTPFQAAAISKVATGVVILRLVDRREIDLDRPVNEALRSWKLSDADAQSVTARQLLSHRAGTNVPGFPGYAVDANLPTKRQILDGSPPANTARVRVEWKPGHAYRPLPDGGHVYPELAAAGLWSTASDLARLALALSASWRKGGLISRPIARPMAQRVDDSPTGLGIFVHPQSGRTPLLRHYGVNAGCRSVLTFLADGSFGLALMTNGEGGCALIPAFCKKVFATNGQGSFASID